MARGFFITGTDTDVGKTTVALGLMAAFKRAGMSVAAYKPVSAGCVQTFNGLRNDDAVRLMQQASIELPYDIVNPYAFEAPIAPHIAATEQHVEIDINVITQAYWHISERVDVVIVEGAGGWLVPLNDTQTLADAAGALQLDIIQVVGLRLGCLNHALLTSANIAAHGLTQVGWVANQLTDNMCNSSENIRALQQRLTGKCIGVIPNLTQTHPNGTAQYLNVETLL
jgi:dethiobiotin synthetase